MYVDCEFKLKDDSKGIPSHILMALIDVYHWLREYGMTDYYIGYSGRGVFHFGCNRTYLSLEEDLHDMLKLGALWSWHWKAFLWLKRNTIYRGSSENAEGAAKHPDDFFEYVEEIIKRYEDEKSNG